MTFSVRQSAIADVTPHAATLGSAIVEGNLLIAFAEERSGETDFVMSNSGWTLGVELYQSVSDGTYRKSFATWYKIAGASESTTVTVTTTTGAAPVAVGYAEFQGDAGEMATITFGAAVATGSDTPAAFYTSGTTASVASTNKLLIGHCYTKVGGGTEAPYSDWSQGTDTLTEFAERNGGASNLNSSWAWAASSVSGTNSVRADKDVGSTDSNRGAITSLMVFTVGAAAVPGAASGSFGFTGTASGRITNVSLVEAGALFAAASGTSITPVIPASAVANDVMLMGVMCNGSTTFSTPTDWTILGTSVESNASQSTEWYWKRHDGSESNPTSTTSATLSTTLGGYGRVYLFRGCVTTGDPFEDVTMAGTPTSSTTPTTAAIDTTGNKRLAVSLLSVDDDNTWSSGNPPAGWTTVGRVSSTTGGDAMMDAIVQQIPTAANVPQATIGTMSAADFWRTLTLALIPEPLSQTVSGAGSAEFGFTGTAAGVPETLGVAAASFGFTATASGTTAVTVTGTALATFGFTGASSGVDRALGVAATALGFTGAAAGVDRALGLADAALGGTFTAAGLRRAHGQAVALFGGTFTAAGQTESPAVTGQATGSFGGTFAAAGVDRALGVAVASLGFTATAEGSGAAQVTGAASAALGFTATAQGVDVALGVATASFGFTGSALGTDRALGVAVASFGYTATTTGQRHVFSVAVATLGFDATVVGVNLSIVVPPERTIVVPAEDRFALIGAEDRVIVVPAENRTMEA